MAATSSLYTISGLQTLAFTVPATGIYQLAGKITLPTLTDDGNTSASLVVTTIKQNGSTMYTGPAGAEGFAVTLNCTISDAITVQLTSAATADAVPNAVKAVVSFG
jgi:hypothetical protein